MKHLALILCVAAMLALASCDDESINIGGDGDVADMPNPGGGMPPGVSNLQAFVVSLCTPQPLQPQPFTPPAAIAAGASFPSPQTANPATSVYTRKCLP